MKNNKLKKKITFFYSDHIEKSTWLNLKERSEIRGYKTNFSKNLEKKAEIGFYNHDQNLENKAKLSIISLHGMDQGRSNWPNAWIKTRWDLYDIGLLPGKKWAKLWRSSSHNNRANPKKGVYKVGWSKADNIDSKIFKDKVNKIKKKLNPQKKTILYAPTFETDDKQLDILNLAKKLKLNLMIKHWASKDYKIYSDIFKNTVKMNKISKKEYKDTFTFPPKSNIFLYLASADILITDESSVMYEAMLFNVPTVIPNSWNMRINNSNKPRKIKPSTDAYLSCSLQDLPKNISYILENKNKIRKIIKKQKFLHFSYIKKSSDRILDLLDKMICGKNLEKGIMKKKNSEKSFFERLYLKIK
tara:strand:+ start:152 stop:1225 length:1074 start_codon:yes stop_codon:yes gene_type:complete